MTRAPKVRPVPAPGVTTVITFDPGLVCTGWARWDFAQPLGSTTACWRMTGIGEIRPKVTGDLVERIGGALAKLHGPVRGDGVEWWIEEPVRGGNYRRTENAGTLVATQASLYRQHLFTGGLCYAAYLNDTRVQFVPALTVSKERKATVLGPLLRRLGWPDANEHHRDAVALGHAHLTPLHPEWR